MMEATVRTPPTMAQVLDNMVVSALITFFRPHLRGEEVRKRLSRFRVHNQNRGDVVVEEDPRNTTSTVRDLKAYFIVFLVTLC